MYVIWDRLDYSFYSEQAEQKLSVLEHLCWRTPAAPSSKEVLTEQSRDLFQNKMVEHYLQSTEIVFCLSR